MLRERPNLRKYPCGRPVNAQRLRKRTGEASRHKKKKKNIESIRSYSVALMSLIIALSFARFSAYLATVASRLNSRLIILFFAILPYPCC